MIKVKSTPELSDNGYVYWQSGNIEDVIGNEKFVILYGDDVVRKIFGCSLEECIGTTIERNGVTYRANYLYSSICKREGRAEAFYLIDRWKPNRYTISKSELTSIDELGQLCAFDIETGGRSGIRCISFYSDLGSKYIDCRDIKSNKSKFDFIKNIFTTPRDWIAHYSYHDISTICKVLKIPFFYPYIDTIWFHRKVEFRSLGYLAGVYLGSHFYKKDLEEANLTKDFDKLTTYCCYDSYYTFLLTKNRTFSKTLRNVIKLRQVLRTMFLTPDMVLKQDILDFYPHLSGMSKKELRKQVSSILPQHIPVLRNSLSTKRTPTISYHGLEGLNVTVPSHLTYKNDVYVTSYADSIIDIMAMDERFNEADVVMRRYTESIDPIRHYYCSEDNDSILLTNDVCTISSEPINEHSFKCSFEEARRLLYRS